MQVYIFVYSEVSTIELNGVSSQVNGYRIAVLIPQTEGEVDICSTWVKKSAVRTQESMVIFFLWCAEKLSVNWHGSVTFKLCYQLTDVYVSFSWDTIFMTHKSTANILLLANFLCVHPIFWDETSLFLCSYVLRQKQGDMFGAVNFMNYIWTCLSLHIYVMGE